LTTARLLGSQEKELSNLVKRFEVSRAMWLYMVLSCGFNDADNLPFIQLRYYIGTEKWEQLKEELQDKSDGNICDAKGVLVDTV